MFAVPGVQCEGLPHEDGRRCHAEADTYPLVDADHVEDDEQDEESQQTSAENEEVLGFQTLELDRIGLKRHVRMARVSPSIFCAAVDEAGDARAS